MIDYHYKGQRLQTKDAPRKFRREVHAYANTQINGLDAQMRKTTDATTLDTMRAKISYYQEMKRETV